MNIIKKLAGETAVYGISSILGRFLNYLLVPLYTRALLPSEYGVVSEFYAYSGFLMVLLSYRMESAFFRFGTSADDRDKIFSTGFYSLSFSTVVFTALIFLFSQNIANLLGYPNHPEYIRWFALMLGFDALCELPFARLRLEQKPYRFMAIRLTNIGINIGLNLFWLVFCPWAAKNGMTWVNTVWRPDMGVSAIFLANLIASGITFLLLLPEVRATIREKLDTTLWTKMMQYAAPLIIVGFAGIANEMLDRVLLKWLLPGTMEQNQTQLGIYGANYKLAMIITLFVQAYRYAAEPFFFRNAEKTDALETQAAATKWFSLTATAAMLFILLYLDWIKDFISEPYHGGLFVVPILLVANVFLGVYYNFSVWYRLKDKTAMGAWIAIGGALITLIINALFIPKYGFAASAWATLICYFCMCLMTFGFGRKIYPAPYPIFSMLFYLILALVLWQISERVVVQNLPLNLLVKTLFLAVFGFFVWWREFKSRP